MGDMMDIEQLRQQLPVGSLGEPLLYFTTIGSTNDYAKEIAQSGTSSGTLILADEQTAGRGRWDRNWFTPPESALALSLIVKPENLPTHQLARLNGAAALAVCEALESFGGKPGIKWPNDVLLAGRKVAGILVEAGWQEQQLEYVVIGVGVNVTAASVPPAEGLAFPATCAESELGQSVARETLLLGILSSLTDWLARAGTESLVAAWNQRLAYRNDQVAVEGKEQTWLGELVGVDETGSLQLRLDSGERKLVADDFVRLRPVDKNSA
jgi:BirA family biotin operon repressor/biotin-[acetyl-CoA-carboxylase] ligase